MTQLSQLVALSCLQTRGLIEEDRSSTRWTARDTRTRRSLVRPERTANPGAGAGTGDSSGLGREGQWCVHDGLVLDGGQASEPFLSAAAVVGAFDPCHDRDAELLAGVPPLPVQDVLLGQAEEQFHRGVVAGGAASAHRSDHVVAVQGVAHLAGSKLGSSVCVQDASGGVAAGSDGVVQGVHGQLGWHAVTDGVAHDAVGVKVFDRAQVELAFTGGVLSDVRQPHLVRAVGPEDALHEVVEHRRSCLGGLAAFAPLRGRHQACSGRQ